MTTVYLCDLDGTIANNSHRTHFIKTKPKNWKAYNAGMADDTPIWPVVDLVWSLWGANEKVVFVSGREEKYREVTEQWLEKHLNLLHDIELHMRPSDNYEPDDVIKERILNHLRKQYPEGTRFVAIDDRKRVKRNCWVKNGVFVFDVNQYDEEY